ncbi:MAG: hypothetical protein KDK38_10735 [Leptospiraceae bacterium]|nr:hypothetical protein [Leptospiraceae bacterium]
MRTISINVLLKILSGGVPGIIGWFFFSFGSIFFWVFQGPQAAVELVKFSGNMPVAEGFVIDIQETSATSNNRRIYSVEYKFRALGNDYQHLSYTVNPPLKNDEIKIEYNASDPGYSRMLDGNYSRFGPYALLVILLPAIGLVFLTYPLPDMLRKIQLIHSGELTTGKWIKPPISHSILTFYKHFFAFYDLNGQEHQIAIARRSTFSHEIEDTVPIVYLRNNPGIAYPVFALPGNPTVTPEGSIHFQEKFNFYQTVPLCGIFVQVLLLYLFM